MHSPRFVRFRKPLMQLTLVNTHIFASSAHLTSSPIFKMEKHFCDAVVWGDPWLQQCRFFSWQVLGWFHKTECVINYETVCEVHWSWSTYPPPLSYVPSAANILWIILCSDRRYISSFYTSLKNALYNNLVLSFWNLSTDLKNDVFIPW